MCTWFSCARVRHSKKVEGKGALRKVGLTTVVKVRVWKRCGGGEGVLTAIVKVKVGGRSSEGLV